MSGRSAAWERGGGRRTAGWRIKACWLGAPASLLLCPSTVHPGSRAGKAPELRPGTWTLAPSPFPPHLPSQLESLVSGAAAGRRKRAERKRGGGGGKSRTCSSWAPHWPPGACRVGGRRRTAEVGARVLRAPSPGPAPPQCTLTSAAFIYSVPLAQPLPGEGWVLGLYRINANPDGAGLFAVASDPLSPRRLLFCLPEQGRGQQGF